MTIPHNEGAPAMKKYTHIARAVMTRPWAIKRNSVEWAAIMDVLDARVSGTPFSDEEIERRLAAVPRRSVAVAASEDDERFVSVLPIYGVLMPRSNIMIEMSGGASVTQLSAAFGEAINDERVVGIVLDVDSPGGLVDGIPEFAAQIREARGTKPIVAIADTMAASAAFWLASQADEVSITPSGEVGSIGVFTEHENAAKFWEEMGIDHTYISAGRYKTEGSEYEALGKDAEAHLQAIVDDYYRMFVDDVAKGRGIKSSAVRSGYGEGRVLTASMAKTEGMVDRVETLGQAIDRLTRMGGRRRGRSALEDIGGKAVAIAVDQADPAFTDDAVLEAAAEDAPAVIAFEVELARAKVEQRRRHRTS